MFKFNTDNIFVGQIKQLLAEFNLPTYRIYSREDSDYLKYNLVESPEIFESTPSGTTKYRQHIHNFSYIRNNGIYKYRYLYETKTNALTGAEYNTETYYWDQVGSYFPGQKLLNNTKTLKIKNNIYDTYTHEYLGNYLRFLRDYYQVDLMPLYNCFSNKVCDNLLIDFTSKSINKKFIFKSSDTKFKIYMLPVKLFKNYTIAIDCDSTVEMCCGLFGKYYYSSLEYKNFPLDTYKSYTQLKFNQPILYTALTDIFSTNTSREKLLDIAKSDEDLKLFIKVPINLTSSIVVLEGDYRNYNDELTIYKKGAEIDSSTYDLDKRIHLQNHSVTNFENRDKDDFISALEYSEERNFKPITKLELLTLNTGESYPFSSKLFEYLTDNVITDLDEIPDNITRVQRVVRDWSGYRINELEGVWDPRIKPAIYEFITKNNNKLLVNQDSFGYVDKSVETNFNAYDTINQKVNSIANIDIYDDLYLAQKE